MAERASRRGEGRWYRRFFDREYVGLLKDQFSPSETRRQARFIVRALALRRGERVLDVACGFGRHSAELARRGLRVTGADLSSAMLAEARRLWRGRPGLGFVRADMRRLPFRARFDAAACMFTSFGYFAHRDNLRALCRIIAALKPGGRLLVDQPNLEYVLIHHSPRHWMRIGASRWVLEESSLDRRSGTWDSVWWVLQPARGRIHRRASHVRVCGLAEWKRMLAAAGARFTAAYGAYDGARHRGARHRRLLIVARRDGRPERASLGWTGAPSAGSGPRPAGSR